MTVADTARDIGSNAQQVNAPTDTTASNISVFIVISTPFIQQFHPYSSLIGQRTRKPPAPMDELQSRLFCRNALRNFIGVSDM